MRYLKIASNGNEGLQLENVPDEYQFVEQIAKRYAKSNDELKSLYSIGVDAANKYKARAPETNYHSKVAWIVEQTIKSEKLKG